MKVLNIFFACTVVSLLLLLESTSAGDSSAANPCCYYPCQHSGVCVRYGTDQYKCDCSGTQESTAQFVTGFWAKVQTMLKPSPTASAFVLTHFQKFWDYVNNSFLRDTFTRLVLTVRIKLIPLIPTYNTKYGYLNWESYYNTSYYTRILLPVPEDCPLPMGVKGKPALPDVELLLEKFFKRRFFKPDPQGTNVMFTYMAHHFTHQFFHTDVEAGPGFTKALGHGVDGSHIYGVDLTRQRHLCLQKDGKLKYQLVNGEMYPPTIKEAPVFMMYPETVPPEQRLAIGHEIFGLVPGLSLYATIWLREHNRLCDILKEEHPTWDDEQLFQTARLIVIETIKIIIEEYVQQLSGYFFKLKFDPSLLFNEQFQYSNRLAMEFDHFYHWHSLLPDSYFTDGDEISATEFVFNGSVLTRYGVEKMVDSFTRQIAGQIGGGQNFHESVIRVIRNLLQHGREVRLQPFNEYRKKFVLKPYKSFSELTDNVEIARGLEEAYGDIDAVEFFPGLMLEKTPSNRIFGESMLQMGAPFSLKSLMGNVICSPEHWKPSTFGGETGFNIVNTATLKKLVCLNTKWCPYVAFHVPRNEEEAECEVKQIFPR